MRLVTWNLDGLGPLRVDERTEAAVFLAITGRTLAQLGRGERPAVAAPDVLTFQEVTGHTFRAHLRAHLPKAGYALHPSRPPDQEEFEVLAVRAPARFTAVDLVPLRRSLLGRSVTVADIDGIAALGSLRVLTAHFDSGSDQAAVRIDAIEQVAALMHERSVFAGDANLRDEEWEAVAGRVALSDAWEQCEEPWEVASTWRRGERAFRFDRVWVGAGLRATSMDAIGRSAVNRSIGPPSDHLGLRVELAALSAYRSSP